MSGSIDLQDRVFFDTNILIYEFDPRVVRKQRRAQDLVKQALDGGSATISYQVVQEFLHAMTAKFAISLSTRDLQAYLVHKLWPMCEILPSPSLYATALSVRDETGYRFYDALIVSAALLSGCSILYTEDLQAGRIVQGLEIRNPFA